MNVRFLTDTTELAARWQDVAPLLAPVVSQAAHGEFTLDDIRARCEARHMIAALCETNGVPAMAMAFEFRHYPQFMAINIVALGGRDLDAVAPMFLDRFKPWAKEAGADRIEASCSDAMARLLKKYGFGDLYRQVGLAV